MGEQLTFGELWRTARWRWRALLAAFLACGVAGYALFALLPGRYTARGARLCLLLAGGGRG